MTEERNWAGNYAYAAKKILYPETVEQVQEIVAQAQKVRTLGSRHSFNGIADSPDCLISLKNMPETLSFDSEKRTVTVAGGVKYGELGNAMQARGFALHNLASLPHISVAGACATATHGSGTRNGNLATGVSALEIITANGELKTLSKEGDGEMFHGSVVGLGALGVVTKVTLDLLPTFEVRQDVYENLPLSQLERNYEEIISSAYSVSLFTDWTGGKFDQVWLKSRIADSFAYGEKQDFFGATPAAVPTHPIRSESAVSCSQQLGVPGPWHERLPHFRMDFTPSSGEELQSEYFVPRERGLEALRAVFALSEQISPLILISEVRTVAGDSLWMSPCYWQDSLAIHFTWKKDWESVEKILPLIEASLASFDARPHWGKLFTMQPRKLRSLYSKLLDFSQLLSSLDPSQKFRNPFLDNRLFLE